MSTISHHIAAIRSLIKEHTDDSYYEDQFLYSLLKAAAQRLMRERLDKYRFLSQWFWKDFCIGTEKTRAHDCSCVAAGCYVLKSVVEIPKPFTKFDGDLFKVFTLDYNEIPYVTPQAQKTNRYDPVMSSEITYSIVNNKIELWNTNLLAPKAIIVSTVPNDITDWDGITLCDEDGNETCYDAMNDDFPLDPDLDILCWNMAVRELGFSFQVPEDKQGDANSTK